MKNSARKGSILIAVLIFVVLVIGAYLLFKPKLPSAQIQPTPQPQTDRQGKAKVDLQEYTSQDLKISFKYPEGWFIEDEYPFLLIANFKSNLHEDFQLSSDQIEILISNFNGCHDTIEQNLIDPACGEGGLAVAKNKIVSKEVKQTKGGIFYEYLVQTPNKTPTFYLFENNDKVLHIEKHPDPSQFEKEFEEIVNSIRFL